MLSPRPTCARPSPTPTSARRSPTRTCGRPSAGRRWRRPWPAPSSRRICGASSRPRSALKGGGIPVATPVSPRLGPFRVLFVRATAGDLLRRGPARPRRLRDRLGPAHLARDRPPPPRLLQGHGVLPHPPRRSHLRELAGLPAPPLRLRPRREGDGAPHGLLGRRQRRHHVRPAR